MDGQDLIGDDAERRHPIFIEDFVDVGRSFDAVHDVFTGNSDWLAPLASAAAQDGESLRMRIGPSWAAGLVTREVEVLLGPPRARDDTIFRSLAWRASGLKSLFPLLDGEIELAPIGLDSCRVSVSVVYTPPLGGLGARIDRALLHRVAASTVRSFISRVATNFQEESDQPSP
jgi:hypothetical protein